MAANARESAASTLSHAVSESVDYPAVPKGENSVAMAGMCSEAAKPVITQTTIDSKARAWIITLVRLETVWG